MAPDHMAASGELHNVGTRHETRSAYVIGGDEKMADVPMPFDQVRGPTDGAGTAVIERQKKSVGCRKRIGYPHCRLHMPRLNCGEMFLKFNDRKFVDIRIRRHEAAAGKTTFWDDVVIEQRSRHFTPPFAAALRWRIQSK